MSFRLTEEMMNAMCQKGMTVNEMAEQLTASAGFKVSVGAVRKTAEHYGISLKAKPRKSLLILDEPKTPIQTTIENNVGVTSVQEVGAIDMV